MEHETTKDKLDEYARFVERVLRPRYEEYLKSERSTTTEMEDYQDLRRRLVRLLHEQRQRQEERQRRERRRQLQDDDERGLPSEGQPSTTISDDDIVATPTDTTQTKDMRTTTSMTPATTTTTTTTTLVDLGYQRVYCNAVYDGDDRDETMKKTTTTTKENDVDGDDDDDGRYTIDRLYVHVGMGFHVELTIEEALVFVARRLEFLSGQVLKQRQARTAKVHDHIQSTQRILDQLAREFN